MQHGRACTKWRCNSRSSAFASLSERPSVAAFSLWYASRPADKCHPYGHGRIVYFSTGFEGALVLAASIAVILSGIEGLIRGPQLRQLEVGLLIAGVLARVPDARLTGHPTQRLPNNASFVFNYIEGEGILLNLDMLGICGSSGSACTSASLEPSHVLQAMGIPVELAHGSLRLSLGHSTTEEDIDFVIERLPVVVQKLREISPLYDPASCPTPAQVV